MLLSVLLNPSLCDLWNVCHRHPAPTSAQHSPSAHFTFFYCFIFNFFSAALFFSDEAVDELLKIRTTHLEWEPMMS